MVADSNQQHTAALTARTQVAASQETLTPAPDLLQDERRGKKLARDKVTDMVFSLARQSFAHASTDTLKGLSVFLASKPKENAGSSTSNRKMRFTEAQKVAAALIADEAAADPVETKNLETECGSDICQRMTAALADRLMNLKRMAPDMSSSALRIAGESWRNIMPKDNSPRQPENKARGR